MTESFEFLETLLNERYSCRAFRPDPVPESTIRQIVAAAGRAPSWSNTQPWQVTVTRGDETARFRDVLLKAVDENRHAPDLAWPRAFPAPHRKRRLDCGLQLYGALRITREDQDARAAQARENYRFFGAPHVAIVHSEAALGPTGAMDCGGFVTTFMLAATALGLASVAQAAVAGYAPTIRDHFGLSENRLILCAIAFGHADPDHPVNSYRTTRAELLEIYDPRG